MKPFLSKLKDDDELEPLIKPSFICTMLKYDCFRMKADFSF